MSVLAKYLGGARAGALASGKPLAGMNPMAAITGQGAAFNPMASASSGAVNPSEVGQKMMADLMRDFGLTQAQAAGFVGNLAHESGDFKTLQEIDPMVEGSRGGFGYAQWTGPRRRQFEAWAEQNGLDPTSYEANYGFLKYELANTPEGAVLGALRTAETPDEAARVVSERFLRPGIPHMDSRVSRARSYYGNPLSNYPGA